MGFPEHLRPILNWTVYGQHPTIPHRTELYKDNIVSIKPHKQDPHSQQLGTTYTAKDRNFLKNHTNNTKGFLSNLWTDAFLGQTWRTNWTQGIWYFEEIYSGQLGLIWERSPWECPGCWGHVHRASVFPPPPVGNTLAPIPNWITPECGSPGENHNCFIK